jgi:RimJ/RimL family protein N-acetyltransferase
VRRDLVLIPIDRDGVPRGHRGALSEEVEGVLAATAQLYAAAGFEAPWIGYLAVIDGKAMGTCSFKSPPQGGQVEIAYFTFPGFEGQGLATAMGHELVAIARRHSPEILVTAQTLPDRNASHSVLEKLGFRHVATLEHHEDGIVWEWHLPPVPPA